MERKRQASVTDFSIRFYIGIIENKLLIEFPFTGQGGNIKLLTVWEMQEGFAGYAEVFQFILDSIFNYEYSL
jgi:hypothetical protein